VVGGLVGWLVLGLAGGGGLTGGVSSSVVVVVVGLVVLVVVVGDGELFGDSVDDAVDVTWFGVVTGVVVEVLGVVVGGGAEVLLLLEAE